MLRQYESSGDADAICMEQPPLLQTLSQLYESSGDAEAIARNSLHCCKPLHSYTSHLEMLRQMVYTPWANVNGVSSS